MVSFVAPFVQKRRLDVRDVSCLAGERGIVRGAVQLPSVFPFALLSARTPAWAFVSIRAIVLAIKRNPECTKTQRFVLQINVSYQNTVAHYANKFYAVFARALGKQRTLKRALTALLKPLARLHAHAAHFLHSSTV